MTTQCHVKKQRQTSSAWEAFAKVSLHGSDHMECLLCIADPSIYLSLLGSTTISMLTHLWQHHPAELVHLIHGDESVVPPRAERVPMSESFANPIYQDKREDSVLQIAIKDEMGLRTVESKGFFEWMNALHRRAKSLSIDTLPRKVTQTHAFELEKVKLRMAQVDAMISISPGESATLASPLTSSMQCGSARRSCSTTMRWNAFLTVPSSPTTCTRPFATSSTSNTTREVS